MESARPLNVLAARIATRAETSEPQTLVRTFVNVQPVADALCNPDNQILYGRRGTGKTHTLHHLAAQVLAAGGLPIYLDLRQIGSNTGLYSDDSEPLSLRGTTLLVDILEGIHNELLSRAIVDDRFEGILHVLDDFVVASTQVKVKGPVTESEETEHGDTKESGSRAHITVSPKGLDAGIEASAKSAASQASKKSRQISGTETPKVVFGQLRLAAEKIAEQMQPHRIWVLLDEWTSVPIALQPILADMLRRAIFPLRGWVVKIGAIERRSLFYQPAPQGTDYVGLEPSADTGASLNLDEHLQEGEAGPEARSFFAELIFRHLEVLLEEHNKGTPYPDRNALVRDLCDVGAFEELVRAAEGVPRDAIQLLGKAARCAGKNKIQRAHVRKSAMKHFTTDKEVIVTQNQSAWSLWKRIQKTVVLDGRSRIFLVKKRSDTPASLLDLHDARLIHLIRPSLTVRGKEDVYDGYCVDYGSYVNLLEEAEIDAAWDVRNSPWLFSDQDFYLSDNFDKSKVIRVHKSN
ncbi:hypothetical protein [Streptomyces sp. NRRL S-813]|uniref:ORC-CDC6 family AAA ATPase n=1 Tax=Streptomyces sp. NRRL S-813 TaxID=1463919 RepID=UPI00131B2FB6|nr:hypothetical protein [Streptomyces sp. NRRL S-813]